MTTSMRSSVNAAQFARNRTNARPLRRNRTRQMLRELNETDQNQASHDADMASVRARGNLEVLPHAASGRRTGLLQTRDDLSHTALAGDPAKLMRDVRPFQRLIDD